MRGGRRAISRGIPRAYRGFPQQHLIALLGDLHPEPAPLEWLYFGGGRSGIRGAIRAENGSLKRRVSLSRARSNTRQPLCRIAEAVEFQATPLHQAEEQATHTTVGSIKVVEYPASAEFAARSAEQDHR